MFVLALCCGLECKLRATMWAEWIECMASGWDGVPFVCVCVCNFWLQFKMNLARCQRSVRHAARGMGHGARSGLNRTHIQMGLVLGEENQENCKKQNGITKIKATSSCCCMQPLQQRGVQPLRNS